MIKTITKTGLGALAAAIAITAAAAPGAASAQGYGYSYDPCRRDEVSRGTTGGVIGALAGAAIGSNIAARNARTEGALLGGAVGALAGSRIGKNSAACTDGYAPRSSYNSGYYNDGRVYDRGYYRDSRYGDSYISDRNRRAEYYDDYAYDGRGNSYRVTERASGPDGCTLAESPIYLPDGRVQKRFVRVCPDGAGRYQVVD